MRNCSICNKPIVLVPSASERAKKYGETPSYYTDLFREHSDCVLAKRAADASALMAKICKESGDNIGAFFAKAIDKQWSV